MHIEGIATLSLLGALNCPLLLVLGIVGRWVPWRTLVTKVRKLDSWRVS
jgi:hypothetical protein